MFTGNFITNTNNCTIILQEKLGRKTWDNQSCNTVSLSELITKSKKYPKHHSDLCIIQQEWQVKNYKWQVWQTVGYLKLHGTTSGLTVPDTTRVVHQRMNANGFLLIYSPETNNQRKMPGHIYIRHCYYIYIQNNDHSQQYVLCAWWVFDATSDSSCCLPDCPMGVLSPPLLLINF